MIALVVLAKLSLIAGVLILLHGGGGYFAAGLSILSLHAAAVAMLVALLLAARIRHRNLVRGEATRSGGHAGGIVLHGAAGYDLLVRLLTFGRERQLRDRMLRPARLKPGETVLDVACGTGTFAIAMKRQVGPGGQVFGIDASEGMVARATRKAERAGLEVSFVQGSAQSLPFEDGRFDVVTGTLMLHHLPKPVRETFVCETHRVLKPGGRLLLIDFDRARHKSGFRLHRHGHVDAGAIREMLERNGFAVAEVGDVGMKDMIYFLAEPLSNAS